MTNYRSWESHERCGHAVQEPFGEAALPGHALPGDRPRWPRDRVADVSHIRLEVTPDIAAKSVSGTATHTVRLLNDGTRSIAFDAIDMEIESVTIAERPAKFAYDGASLEVDLGPNRKRGESITVEIAYSARPRLGLYFIEPDEGYPDKPHQVWTQGQDEDSRHWFPCYDYEGQKQTCEVIATVPEEWFALSNGKLVKEAKAKGGAKTFHWKQETPLPTYLITLAAGEFERIDASREGLTIDYFIEREDLEDGKRTFANTPAMIALFERISGCTYPWAKYSQVVVRDFIFGGMENTSATTMTRNIIVDRKASRDFTSDDLVSHELAHMWWGDLLTCRDWSHGWLNEGFATYFEMLWDEERNGIDEYRQGIIANTEAYIGERYRRPIVTKVMRDPIDIFDRHLYEKGSLVLNTLRGVLGDDGFFRSNQRYCRDNQHSGVITQNLVDAIDRETGRNLEWFFDQWVYRPGHPSFKVSWSWDAEANLATVNVRQVQKTDDGTPIFRAPLTIDFSTGRKKPVAFRVEVTEASHTFTFPLNEKPDLCRFDPYSRVLRELDFEKSTGELRFQLKHDDDITGRQLAAKSLGTKGGPDAVAALEDAIHNDRFWGVAAAAAKALGATRSEAARDALIRAAGIRQHKVRRAVAAALGEFRGDEKAFDTLKPLAARDQSWFVEAEAHRSIGKLRLPGSFDILAAGMARKSFRQVVRQGCIDGLVELRDERAFELLLEAAAYGAAQQSRQFAVAGVGRLGQHFEGRKKALAESITPLLDDPDFRVRMAAANALKAFKDPASATLLDRMAQRELDGRAVRVAREGAIALRKGSETASEVKALREELEALRGENAKVKDRIDRMEVRQVKA